MNEFLIWLITPSCPPVCFFICLFTWYLAGFVSEAFFNTIDYTRQQKKKKNEHNK